ncbi:MAG: diaminopimelate decarboxylase [Oscillospiraceae bacterium]|nr:diaminopimelate decarboxylase [Oscillospiraceae bacterium]
MSLANNLSVNEKGNLAISGYDTLELCKEYGTPLYVMDETVIRKACRDFKNSMDKYYDGNGLVCYASKAFSCKEIYRIVKSEGLGIDVVSAGELYTAMSVDFPAEKICFHGNNKQNSELEMALDYGVGHIVVDNFEELDRLSQIAKDKGKTAKIMFRIKPGIDAHTHDFVKTGQIDSKFGFALETGEAFEAIKKSLSCDNIELVGIHCHIGSQIFDITPFEEAAVVMLSLVAKVKNELSYQIPQLNLGGGFGIRYTENDDPKEYDEYMKAVSKVVKETAQKLGVKVPFIIIEPGRSIVGPAGVTLYEIGSVKDIPNIRTYVSVDGGMTDNPRYALYKSEYEFIVANKAGKQKDLLATIAGKCCESGDLLGENVKIQTAQAGDIMAVLATGAYNYSMSSNYNRTPKPAVVMVGETSPRVIVKRETLDDILRNDI